LSLFSKFGYGSFAYSPAGATIDQWIQVESASGRDGREACKVLASRGATIVRLPLLNVIAAYAGIVGRLQNSIGSRRQVGVPA
jgi:hypothetical protein